MLSETPGVYRMLSDAGDVLYVGKAKSLKKRVLSYTLISKLPMRLKRMVAETVDMEFVHTHTETEALLLESNLIKKLEPRYNVLLRDDKSFPYILISQDHDFPRITKHRGAQKAKGKYFGPFASAGSVNRTINALQRAFMIRNCTDSYFSARSRPCLQYHIKRCTAPCVDKISKEDYAEQIDEALTYLNGDSRAVQNRFAKAMEAASESLDFETAARYRDRIKAMTIIQAHQDINVSNLKNADVMGLYMREGRACIQVFFFRGGQNFGNKAYFPKHDSEDPPEYILTSFMMQFYENKPVPPEIVVSHNVQEKDLLEEALSQKREKEGGVVKITKPQRGTRMRLIDFVLNNARDALSRHVLEKAGEEKMLGQVAELFGMENLPKRIEIYDNSHISGTNMVGAMVVAGVDGFRKNAYRKFNIRTADAGDDYAMMREVMERRFGRALRENVDREGGDWPDLLLIDGGLGQFTAVKNVLEELGLWEDLTIVAISKGPDRHAGREKFVMEGRSSFQLPVNDPVLHYLQRLRDEAHRFAIGAHRTRRKNDLSKSPLDQISGIGAKRKKALLLHFGSAKAVARAGLNDLQKVEGVSKAMAENIYNFFHNQ